MPENTRGPKAADQARNLRQQHRAEEDVAASPVPPSSVLITSDNFLIGGRETFVLANLSRLRRDGAIAGLMANRVSGFPLSDFFSEIALPSRNTGSEIHDWLSKGEVLIDKLRPELIWAQQYRLLPAWLLSRLYSIPLLVTFHGPDLVMPGSANPIEALGTTLALRRNAPLSAVSPEISDKVLELCAIDSRIDVMTNRVSVFSELPPLPRGPLRAVLLSRAQKLGHLREGVRLFHFLRRKAGRATLTIYSRSESHIAHGAKEGMWDTARQLGRKWLLKNPELIADLPFVSFKQLTPEPHAAIVNAHLVLGMGRVVLEGLAAGRPSVLIGYDAVIGLVTPERYAAYARSNFSGRGLTRGNPENVAAEAMHALSEAPCLPDELRPYLDIDEGWPATSGMLAAAKQSLLDPADRKLAAAIVSMFQAGGDHSEIVRRAVRLLSPEERRVYAGLIQS